MASGGAPSRCFLCGSLLVLRLLMQHTAKEVAAPVSSHLFLASLSHILSERGQNRRSGRVNPHSQEDILSQIFSVADRCWRLQINGPNRQFNRWSRSLYLNT